MSTFVNLLIVAIVFWGFIAAFLFFLTMRLQRMEKDLSALNIKTTKDN
ncbi:MAG: hypothetical protein ACE5I5_10085 [Candidatus Heimdallarchaeota archaeon]